MNLRAYIFILASLSLSNVSFSAEQEAIFAGGCFWCMEKPFEQISGVKSVVSGYIGGKIVNPTYKQVSSGGSGHYEAVKITYDDSKVSFPDLLFVFWKQINPTDAGGQFVDRGQQYSTGIFYKNKEQKRIAEISKKLITRTKIFDKKIITPIIKAEKFYSAEAYHQDYYKTNPIRYWYYRNGSGRDKYLKSIWTDKNSKSYKLEHNKTFRTKSDKK